MDIYIDNRQDKIEIDEKIEAIEGIINQVIEECLKEEGYSIDVEVSVSFVDNEEIRELNREYRNVDSPTDVLSFPMEEDSLGLFTPLLGDIVISLERALEQSKEYGHSFEREIAYLTAHSMFHLLGYDHMTNEDKKVMREKEKSVMKTLKIFKNE
ncbi:rRNA maturation RNase YbeY [Sporanaerobacter acetigenes]|uniref:Endoribonuclease YbeY n=1 Tax=Sporanaerobacter acetigenes DSM 13106 TaxID=1123281 RepID=A0A1M5UQZ8_9FIRM|nr:rRNA maturation RNase YbeY [Sporanaerobacter acetigenes]SHH65330.1 probable rRNA maturation factor [Sporanaerobacter acetigenes DSM 13106]